MKRTDLLKRVKKMAKDAEVQFELEREGGNHTIYSLNGNNFPVPRHNEINELTAKGILKMAQEIVAPPAPEPEA